MITDRMTAKVLGLLMLVLTVLIDVSCFLFTQPETRQSGRFALVVMVSSLPLFLIGAWLLRKASRMQDNDDLR